MSTVSKKANSVEDARRQMYNRRGRTFIEEGRAQTEEDARLSSLLEIRYIRHDESDKPVAQLWMPSLKPRSFQSGDVFIFRMLPGWSTVKLKTEQSHVIFGRKPDGSFDDGVIRRVGVIRQFGSDRQVSFIPTTPNILDHPPAHSLPDNNPYRLLTGYVYRSRDGLKKAWKPLAMGPKDTTAYIKQNGLNTEIPVRPLLPLPYSQFFTYALIYKGYNAAAQQDFIYTDNEGPYGSDPTHGLQVVGFNDQVYKDLSSLYQKSASAEDEGLGNFYYPDPADFDTAPLNYIYPRSYRNTIFPNPINGILAAKGEGFGYGAEVSTNLFFQPKKGQKISRRLEDDFLDWYLNEAWQTWNETLHGIYGKEQVKLIAEFFPELKPVCKQAWQRSVELMEAWEEYFAGAPSDSDFYALLHKNYANNTSQDEETSSRSVSTKTRNVSESDYVSSTKREEVQEEDSDRYDEGDQDDEEVEERDVDPVKSEKKPSADRSVTRVSSRQSSARRDPSVHEEPDEGDFQDPFPKKRKSPVKLMQDRIKANAEKNGGKNQTAALVTDEDEGYDPSDYEDSAPPESPF
jgi:hypothetical protein